MGARGTPATVAVAKAKVEHRIHEYDHDPAAPSYGLEAAEQLGVDPAGVFKTLVAEVDGRLAVAVVPVAARLDLKALAAAAGSRKASMAERPRRTGHRLRRRRDQPPRAPQAAPRLPRRVDAGPADRDGQRRPAGPGARAAPADLAPLAGATFAHGD